MKRLIKYFALLLVILGSVWALPSGMRAQSTNQAALVVRFSENHTESACVQFEEPEISGLDLLQRSGLDFAIDVQGLGALVCSIENTGCPANDCWCQCKGGADCIYWSYWHRQGNNWQYSQIGAAIYQVEPGSVEGWSWGPGAVTEAIAPPNLTFEDVCQLPATDTSTPSPTPTPSDTPTPIVVSVPDTATPNSNQAATSISSSPTATATSPIQNSPTAAVTVSPSFTTNTPQVIQSATPTGSLEIASPTSGRVQPTQPPAIPSRTPVTVLPTEIKEVNESEELAAELMTPMITVTVTATKRSASVAASLANTSTREPQEIAELPDVPAVELVETSEPLTVVGSGFVPTVERSHQPAINDQEVLDSFADWFPYIVFLIIAGGFSAILLLQSLRQKDNEA